ncbi:hypothetical protein CPB84DRAFT_1793199 [Gymnopilus junonius]|uniref:Uncharacterized protein n=1 Tax=Gymnopilus junonius TaxID=109634 RepID=A0A9P5NC16_GYMJU|nr:hypothetical protein CPB84DRAFT_1793199 [Gymnopilus junonius]
MASAFSGHLVDSFTAKSSFNSSIVSHGAMSFNPMMHGTPLPQQPFSPFNSQSLFANESISEETAKKIATLQVKLDQKLGPEYISQRPGPGGGPKLTYVEGWKIINLANEVFGFNGWSSSVVSLTMDFVDYSEETRRYSVGVTAIMRVTLRDGVYHEDIGYGMLENSKSKGAALDKCKKEAVTDGLKRALRNFGNVLGNCLYDKSYTSEIIKVKFEPLKFNKEELHRRPEFEDVKPKASSLSASTSSSSSIPKTPHANQNAPSRPSMQQMEMKPITPIPQHMRAEVRASSAASTSNTTRTNNSNQVSNVTVQTTVQPHSRQQPITPNSSAQRNIILQQQHAQQSERRVSFSEPTGPPQAAKAADPQAVKYEDDDYGFNSDDAAILAMADLGPPIAADDADVGRPIESDFDTGRPIDQEEGLSRPPEENSLEHVQWNVSRPPASSSRGDDAAKSRQELIEAALRGEFDAVPAQIQDQSKTTISGSGTSLSAAAPAKTVSQQAHFNASNNTYNVSSSSNTTSSSMDPPPLPPFHHGITSSRATSYPQQQHQRYMNQRQQNQDQNVAPQNNRNANAQTSTSNSSFSSNPGDAGVKRTSTPSVGSFRFPPGMNPLQSGVSTGQGVTTGMKRPADAMGPPSTIRGGRPGMGLQQATAGVAPIGKREVLGSLEVGEGGDIKRRRW